MRWLVGGGVVMLAVFAWAYWPTLGGIVHAWVRYPDYSHGFIVLPLGPWFSVDAAVEFPRDAIGPSLIGLALLLVACAVRSRRRPLLSGAAGWMDHPFMGGRGCLLAVWSGLSALESAFDCISLVHDANSFYRGAVAERAAAVACDQTQYRLPAHAWSASHFGGQYDLVG